MADQATPHGSVGAVVDERLRDAVRRAGWDTTGLVVLIGEPAITESGWDAILDPLPDEWRHLWRPLDAGSLLAGLRAAVPPDPWTVVRLNDLRRFLMPPDPELAIEVAVALRAALREPTGRPLLVAASMPADWQTWRLLTQAPASGGHDRWSQARALLRRAVVVMGSAPGAASGARARPRPGRPPQVEFPAEAPIRPSPVRPEPPVVGIAGEAAPAAPAFVPPTGRAALRSGTRPVRPPMEAAAATVRPVEAGESVQLVDLDRERAVSPGDRPPPAAPAASRTRERRCRAAVGQPVSRAVRWKPTPVQPEPPGVSEQALRQRAQDLEQSGDREGAERLYERAAREGDLEALARLASLRGGGAPEPVADELFETAAAEGNTAVLFNLASVGHSGALRLLARLRAQAQAEAEAMETESAARRGPNGENDRS